VGSSSETPRINELKWQSK